ncbi:hypothetical protein BDZ97DRAFT_1247172 [Flammula alnicola]|nr:hypothetical protein BDZ97DRAFT_1247172 [Flammula alnicola]
MSDNEFDNVPDDFADVQDVDWAQLLAGPSTHASYTLPRETPAATHDPVIPPNPPESNDSSSYFSDDDGMDSAFLAELDRVEQRLTQAPQVALSNFLGGGMAAVPRPAAQMAASGSSVSDRMPGGDALAPQPQSYQLSEQQRSHYFSNLTTRGSSSPQRVEDAKLAEKCSVQCASDVPCKRPCSDDALHLISPKKKGKMKTDDHLYQIISGYEDELTCPICCDLFVASHVGNPCGHTFCGECGWKWHFNVENRNKGCPCCRRTLDKTTPIIPNIAMDNVVEKHVRALALSGMQEWEPGGRKYHEWNVRKQAWRDGANQREQRKARHAGKPIISLGTIRVFEMPGEWIPLEDNMDEDPTYEDSDAELIPRPIQRARRRRRREQGRA